MKTNPTSISVIIPLESIDFTTFVFFLKYIKSKTEFHKKKEIQINVIVTKNKRRQK